MIALRAKTCSSIVMTYFYSINVFVFDGGLYQLIGDFRATFMTTCRREIENVCVILLQ